VALAVLLHAAAALAQPSAPLPWPFALDLGAPTAIATVLIDWEEGRAPADYAIETSLDGTTFATARRIEGANGGRDSIWLGHVDARFVRVVPESDARFVRVVPDGDATRFAMRSYEVVPFAAQPNANAFFHAVAGAARRGAYPRYWLQEQSYWTAVGADGDTVQALVSSDGQIEPGVRNFTIEPFLTVNGRFVPWSDAAPEASLADGALPIPSVAWRADPIVLTQTTFATGAPGASALVVRHRVENRGDTTAEVTLWLGIRPFQVNPPWQALGTPGGVTAVHRIARDGRAVWVNGRSAIALLDEPDAFGAARYEQGSLAEFLARGDVPPDDETFDAQGFASGALAYRLKLAPGARRDVSIAVPFHDAPTFLAVLPSEDAASSWVDAAHDTTLRHWRERLSTFDVRLPPAAGDASLALRAAIAQILVARAGPVLRPGTRTYARAWIRDGVLMASALLQMGMADEARAFLRWYLPWQDADGRVPCCIDERGRDWAVEHDAPGQLAYGALSLWRYRRDREIVREAWPHIVRAVDYVDRLRQQRKGAEWNAPDKVHFRGLLPESISHEGYSSRPVHSYWDDFWALRGLKDAVIAAQLVGDPSQERHIAAIRDDFASDLQASIVATMRHHGLDTIPASADLGDFDPSATSAAIGSAGARQLFPQDALDRTYERYVEDFRKRRAGEIAWEAYTPYELRNVEALVRLGRRDDALFLVEEMLGDQRPRGWRQWGEIVWRDPAAPRFIGDVPHAWIASGYVRALRTMLAYEREDGALVLGAGLPLAWLKDRGGVAVSKLPTHYGAITYTMRATGENEIRIDLAGDLEMPKEGIVIAPPVTIESARIDGEPAKEWHREEVVVRRVPVVVEVAY
jgi:hypothetical protein